MTIERRTDYLWGLLKGDAVELCSGSVLEREIANYGIGNLTQSIEVKTPDIISVTTNFPVKPSKAILFQEEINSNNVIYSPKVTWKEALIGKMERVLWTADDRKKGKSVINLIPVIKPT